MRARGEVFEPGKEEPGGVGDGEVFKKICISTYFTFTFYHESRTLLFLFSKQKHVISVETCYAELNYMRK